MRDRELEALGIRDYFDARMTAGDAGRIKPHPEPFLTLLERLGVKAENAVFVGDRPQDDVAGAQAAGMRGVWVRRGSNHAEHVANGIRPNAIIDRLGDLLDILAVWYPHWRRSS